MRRIITAITGFLALALLAGCGAGSTATPSASGSSKGVIRAGSTGQSYPGGYKEGDKLVGFDVETLEQAAQRAGYTVEWTTADFSGLMGQLEAGRLDTVANNVAITDARRATYDFTDVYAYMGAAIVTNTNSDIHELTDLNGKTVSGVLGSNNLKTLESWAAAQGITVNIRTYETRDGAMQDVINGRVDGYVQSRGVLLAEINHENLPLRFVGESIATDLIGLPFAKTDAGKAMRDDINTQIDAMLADGTLADLSEKYFGADVTVPEEAASESAAPSATASA